MWTPLLRFCSSDPGGWCRQPRDGLLLRRLVFFGGFKIVLRTSAPFCQQLVTDCWRYYGFPLKEVILKYTRWFKELTSLKPSDKIKFQIKNSRIQFNIYPNALNTTAVLFRQYDRHFVLNGENTNISSFTPRGSCLWNIFDGFTNKGRRDKHSIQDTTSLKTYLQLKEVKYTRNSPNRS